MFSSLPTSSMAGGGSAASAASAASVRPQVAGAPALSAVARSHLPGGGPCWHAVCHVVHG